jgi:hypothetical protein
VALAMGLTAFFGASALPRFRAASHASTSLSRQVG